ncbi:Lrp/AsnC family transcriptional regulator [Streptomyces sp. NPDC020917]|uniref:Lrp/AsnC family transcriptional regulator n=1 Tax=Streptomyces sp. NPDC020917 TaxID=3365102 RepID=UPI00379E4C49
MNLTETDLDLVEALREDGRASFESLAGRVGLSRKAVRSRVLRLFEEGVLRVVATVRPEFDGIRATAHLSVSVTGARREDVARILADQDETVFVSIVSGRAGVVAEIRTTDLHRLGNAVDRLRGVEGVTRIETLVYTDVVMEPHLPPPGDAVDTDPAVDHLDRSLIALLRADGRTSYADLAAHVGLSAAATRARVRGLLDSGVIRIVTLVNPTKLGRSFMTGFALDLEGAAQDVLHRIGRIGAVDFLALTLGTADAVGTIVTTTVEDTVAVLDRIGSLDGVAGLRSWTHLRLVQERYGIAGG